MTDLIERLRADDLLPADMEFLVEEAADEIERLRDEVTERDKLLTHWDHCLSSFYGNNIIDSVRRAMRCVREGVEIPKPWESRPDCSDEIERYRLTMAGMYKDSDGDWVKYDEIERLGQDVYDLKWCCEDIERRKDAHIAAMQPVIDAAREALIALRACCPPKLNPARITLGKALNTLDKGHDCEQHIRDNCPNCGAPQCCTECGCPPYDKGKDDG